MTTFTRQFELRWSDADANGHIRHTVYAEMGAEARMAFLRDGGFGWDALLAHGIGPVLLKEEIRYFRELGLGDAVSVDLALLGLSPDAARWIIAHDIRKGDGELAGRVVATGGWIDLSARKLTLPPEALARHMVAAKRAEEFQELPPLRR